MFKRKEDNTEDTMFERMIVVHSLITQGLRNDHKHHKKGLQSLMKEQQERPATEMVKFLDKELGGTEEEKMVESYNASIKAEIKPGEKYEQLIPAAEICHGEVSKIGSSW